jgi:diaminopimelate epimerase
MTPMQFTKTAACGNDFLIMDASSASVDLYSITRRICDRHNGVGADGVEWITPGSDDYDVAARLINSDGSEAEVSGNGTRCVAAYWLRLHGGNRVRVLTGAGVKDCTLVDLKSHVYHFEMNMGVPEVGGRKRIAGADGSIISLGNPHFVVFVPSLDIDWQKLGSQIQASGEFPQGTNVEFVRLRDRQDIEARFFERGAGATQSSGTGSCAAAVAAIDRGLAASSVTVAALGGTQVVRWDRSVYLTGPAEIICQGEYFP